MAIGREAHTQLLCYFSEAVGSSQRTSPVIDRKHIDDGSTRKIKTEKYPFAIAGKFWVIYIVIKLYVC